MTSMMHSPVALTILMVLLVALVVGVFVSIRMVGGREFNDDHDR